MSRFGCEPMKYPHGKTSDPQKLSTVLTAAWPVGVFLFVVLWMGAKFWPERRRTQPVSSVSNLKQSSISLHIYAQDSDGRFPEVQGWMDAALEYSGSRDVFRDLEAGKLRPDEYGLAFYKDLDLVEMTALENAPQVPSSSSPESAFGTQMAGLNS